MNRFHRPLFVVAVLILFAVPASAQVSFGVKAGANFSTYTGDDVMGEVGSRTGLVIGGLARLQLAPMFGLQPEILFTQKGVTFSEIFFGEPVEGDIRVDYIEAPILLTITVPVGGPELRPTLLVGPTIAYEVGCTVNFTAFGESGSEDCEDDVDRRRKLDLGLGLAGGLDVAFGTGVLMIEARHTLGLRTLDGGSDPDDVRNSVWSITFGYRFR